MNQDKIAQHLDSSGSIYVSVTGLRVKKFWLYVLFYRYAVPSFMQAQKSSGILFAEVKRIEGVEHTLTVWKSKRDMQKYKYSGIHKKAIEKFRMIATGSTFGYESKVVPNWEEAIARWKSEGRPY